MAVWLFKKLIESEHQKQLLMFFTPEMYLHFLIKGQLSERGKVTLFIYYVPGTLLVAFRSVLI